jgi:hypothetical protein
MGLGAAPPCWRRPRRADLVMEAPTVVACARHDGELGVVASVRQWGKDRMRAAVGKENVAGLFPFWRNRDEGGAEQASWDRLLHRPRNMAFRQNALRQTSSLGTDPAGKALAPHMVVRPMEPLSPPRNFCNGCTLRRG